MQIRGSKAETRNSKTSEAEPRTDLIFLAAQLTPWPRNAKRPTFNVQLPTAKSNRPWVQSTLLLRRGSVNERAEDDPGAEVRCGMLDVECWKLRPWTKLSARAGLRARRNLTCLQRVLEFKDWFPSSSFGFGLAKVGFRISELLRPSDFGLLSAFGFNLVTPYDHS
jgi:hypothetical protein